MRRHGNSTAAWLPYGFHEPSVELDLHCAFPIRRQQLDALLTFKAENTWFENAHSTYITTAASPVGTSTPSGRQLLAGGWTMHGGCQGGSCQCLCP